MKNCFYCVIFSLFFFPFLKGQNQLKEVIVDYHYKKRSVKNVKVSLPVDSIFKIGKIKGVSLLVKDSDSLLYFTISRKKTNKTHFFYKNSAIKYSNHLLITVGVDGIFRKKYFLNIKAGPFNALMQFE